MTRRSISAADDGKTRSRTGWKKCPEKVESFVILDDGDYDWYRHGYDKHLVKTDFCTGGLRKEHVERAIRILNKKHFWRFFKNRKRGAER